MLVLLMLLFTQFGAGLPTVDAVKNYSPPQVTRMLDRHGRVISESFQERRTVVSMKRVPRVLVLSVLAAEDADFYRHRGLDYAGIMRALLRDLTPGRQMQGASTITQQIVKNILLTPERTITRKIRELILARRLEQELTKDEILGLYLNHIYFGHGRYGVQEAARFFFGKDVDRLTLAEASLIAGIPQSPNRLSPLTHPKAARQRQSYVLRQLLAKRQQYWPDLSEEEIHAAERMHVKLADNPGVEGGAPEVVTTAKAVLAQQVGKERSREGGYSVETTIDLALQRNAREALLEGLKALDRRQGLAGPLRVPKHAKTLEPVAELRSGRTYDALVTGADDETGEIQLDIGGHDAVAKLAHVSRFNPEDLPASRFAPVGAVARAMVDTIGQDAEPALARLSLGPQGAVVAIDTRTREVLALVGADEANYGFNRATQAIRQPGSTFKPLVYAVAIESRQFTPATLVLDAPGVFDKWRPNNYEMWQYEGDVRLREGLAKSINLVAVRVIEEVTPRAVVEFARSLGITTELDPSLALALGASGVRPIELVNAYATFAAGGTYSAPKMVRRIRDAKGTTITIADEGQAPSAMSPGVAFVMTSMLGSVVQNGTAQAAKKLNRPVAGKTGTSNRARDAWFIGFTPDLVVGVWVGYDDHRPLGRGETGGKSALPIWIDIMKAATADTPVTDFPVPNDVERAMIDPKTGKLAFDGQTDGIDEIFLVGTVPKEVAELPDVMEANDFYMQQQL